MTWTITLHLRRFFDCANRGHRCAVCHVRMSLENPTIRRGISGCKVRVRKGAHNAKHTGKQGADRVNPKGMMMTISKTQSEILDSVFRTGYVTVIAGSRHHTEARKMAQMFGWSERETVAHEGFSGDDVFVYIYRIADRARQNLDSKFPIVD